jgi:hypothetical protein
MQIPNAGRFPLIQNLQLTPKKGIEAGSSVETPASLPQDTLFGVKNDSAQLLLQPSPFSPASKATISNVETAPLKVSEQPQTLDLSIPQQLSPCWETPQPLVTLEFNRQAMGVFSNSLLK